MNIDYDHLKPRNVWGSLDASAAAAAAADN
jgi:hypothetical protein